MDTRVYVCLCGCEHKPLLEPGSSCGRLGVLLGPPRHWGDSLGWTSPPALADPEQCFLPQRECPHLTWAALTPTWAGNRTTVGVSASPGSLKDPPFVWRGITLEAGVGGPRTPWRASASSPRRGYVEWPPCCLCLLTVKVTGPSCLWEGGDPWAPEVTWGVRGQGAEVQASEKCQPQAPFL